MVQAKIEEVHFPGGGGEIQGWLACPTEAGRYPAIALLHGRNGPSDSFRDVANRFAEEGIVGLAVNYMTHKEEPPLEEMNKSTEGALGFLSSQSRVDPARIAVGGYCKGGGLTYQALAKIPGFSAGVIWHGGLSGDNLQAALNAQAPMLIIHGASDTPVPIDKVYDLTKELNQKGKRFELKVYHGCDHAFTLPGGARYVAEPADDAFREAVLFLRRIYGIPVGTVSPLVPTAKAA
ncbi:MAG: prolyl oligopeptidase family serine peptidase [Deltaproteobacteria bacterium]|nr:prolyl oligopeptidase family serine peptidase [Deltaproteobacteria bacterium]